MLCCAIDIICKYTYTFTNGHVVTISVSQFMCKVCSVSKVWALQSSPFFCIQTFRCVNVYLLYYNIPLYVKWNISCPFLKKNKPHIRVDGAVRNIPERYPSQSIFLENNTIVYSRMIAYKRNSSITLIYTCTKILQLLWVFQKIEFRYRKVHLPTVLSLLVSSCTISWRLLGEQTTLRLAFMVLLLSDKYLLSVNSLTATLQ